MPKRKNQCDHMIKCHKYFFLLFWPKQIATTGSLQHFDWWCVIYNEICFEIIWILFWKYVNKILVRSIYAVMDATIIIFHLPRQLSIDRHKYEIRLLWIADNIVDIFFFDGCIQFAEIMNNKYEKKMQTDWRYLFIDKSNDINRFLYYMNNGITPSIISSLKANKCCEFFFSLSFWP